MTANPVGTDSPAVPWRGTWSRILAAVAPDHLRRALTDLALEGATAAGWLHGAAFVRQTPCLRQEQCPTSHEIASTASPPSEGSAAWAATPDLEPPSSTIAFMS